MRDVVVVDYGLGNLLSVARALVHVGGTPRITEDAEAVATADRLLLPGVGTFADGMNGLRARGLTEAVRAFAATGRPLLGICLGMQMFMEKGKEFGQHEGLGLLAGTVVAVPPTGTDGRRHRIPHIGWNEISAPDGGPLPGPLFTGLGARPALYFVHSFMAVTDDPERTIATCDYHGWPIAAAVGCGNLYGCQFHPEKSGPAGLRILENFLAL